MITVIITIYNREKTLERAIKSFFEQDYDDKSLILIDDGSTDDSAKICKNYTNLKNVIYFYQDNKGAAAAKNSGVKIAKSEYITFLDSDDYFKDANVLSKINNIIISNRKSIDFVSFSSILIKRKEIEIIDNYNMDDIYNNGVYIHMLKSPLNYAAHNPYTFKREKFISSGMLDETAKWGDALLFWRRFFSQNINSVFINDIGYVYDQTDGVSVSRGRDKKKKIIIYNVIFDSYKELKPKIKKIKYDKVWELILFIKSIETRDCKFIFFSFLNWCTGHPVSCIKSLIYIFRTKVFK